MPVTRRLLADSETAGRASTASWPATGPGTLLLESAEQGKQWSRYSLRRGAQRRRADRAGRAQRSGSATPLPGLTDDLPADPLDAVARRWPGGCARPRTADLPPLTGGLVGYLGYDVVRRLERLPQTRRPTTSACPSSR